MKSTINVYSWRETECSKCSNGIHFQASEGRFGNENSDSQSTPKDVRELSEPHELDDSQNFSIDVEKVLNTRSGSPDLDEASYSTVDAARWGSIDRDRTGKAFPAGLHFQSMSEMNDKIWHSVFLFLHLSQRIRSFQATAASHVWTALNWIAARYRGRRRTRACARRPAHRSWKTRATPRKVISFRFQATVPYNWEASEEWLAIRNFARPVWAQCSLEASKPVVLTVPCRHCQKTRRRWAPIGVENLLKTRTPQRLTNRKGMVSFGEPFFRDNPIVIWNNENLVE